jgi:hypothetical protein
MGGHSAQGWTSFHAAQQPMGCSMTTMSSRTDHGRTVAWRLLGAALAVTGVQYTLYLAAGTSSPAAGLDPWVVALFWLVRVMGPVSLVVGVTLALADRARVAGALTGAAWVALQVVASLLDGRPVGITAATLAGVLLVPLAVIEWRARHASPPAGRGGMFVGSASR